MQRITERQLAAIEGRNDIDVFLDERTRRIPLGRRTDCETVAGMIVWLALDAPDYITAETAERVGWAGQGLTRSMSCAGSPRSQHALVAGRANAGPRSAADLCRMTIQSCPGSQLPVGVPSRRNSCD